MRFGGSDPFGEILRRHERKVATASVNLAIGTLFVVFLAGWVFFLTYNAFRPGLVAVHRPVDGVRHLMAVPVRVQRVQGPIAT